jgi:phage FluMu gp28-like protein
MTTLAEKERAKVLRWNRPKLYPKQHDAFFNDCRYSICEATTKAGKTVGGMTWLVERGLRGTAGQNRWWVAPVVNQAKIAYKRIKRGLPADLIRTWETDRIIELPNKSLLRFMSGEDPDNLYGEDVFDAVIDEVSRLREESWFAIRSTLTATQGWARLIGNVKGRQNFAYRLARKAEAGEQGWHYSKIKACDAVEAGVISAEEVEDARRTLPEQVFRELYEAEPSDDGGNPFGLGAIARCIAPLSTAPPMIWGIDLAKSVDWTVCIALDNQKRVCRFERWQSPWGETKQRINQLVTSTCRRAFVDSTGVGDSIVEDLQRLGGVSCYEGFKFTSSSKQQLMESLAAAIQNQEITFPDGVIRKELESYEYEYTRTGVRYTAPAGLHDDCVCALALAVFHGKPRNSLWNF